MINDSSTGDIFMKCVHFLQFTIKSVLRFFTKVLYVLNIIPAFTFSTIKKSCVWCAHYIYNMVKNTKKQKSNLPMPVMQNTSTQNKLSVISKISKSIKKPKIAHVISAAIPVKLDVSLLDQQQQEQPDLNDQEQAELVENIQNTFMDFNGLNI